jgi:hypothetical protein
MRCFLPRDGTLHQPFYEGLMDGIFRDLSWQEPHRYLRKRVTYPLRGWRRLVTPSFESEMKLVVLELIV